MQVIVYTPAEKSLVPEYITFGEAATKDLALLDDAEVTGIGKTVDAIMKSPLRLYES